MRNCAAIYGAIALFILLEIKSSQTNIYRLWGDYFVDHEWGSEKKSDDSKKDEKQNPEVDKNATLNSGVGQIDSKGKSKKKIPILQSINSHVYGRYYLRGFPRGGLGSKLFPATCKEEGTVAQGTIYDINHPAFKRNPQDGFRSLIDKLGEHYCKNDDKCCDSKTELCKESPKRKAIVQMLAEPRHSLQVIFLYRWCTEAWSKFQCRTLAAKVRKFQIIVRGATDQNTSSDKNSTAKVYLVGSCLQTTHDNSSDKGTPEPPSDQPFKEDEFSEETLTNLKKFYNDVEKFCPNPCHGNPCARTFGVLNKRKCDVVGPFEDSYECECDKGRKWDPATLQCLLRNPCADQKYPPCVPANTLQCVARYDGTVGCICKEEFMGEDCSLPRDACLERINKSRPNGNTNCQIIHGNECTPISGTDYYTCTCKYGFLPNRALSEDNCAERRDPCIDYYVGQTLVQRAVTCLNGGHCISSEDFTRAFCICPKSADGSPMFEGPNCEIPIGVWSAWSSPTICLPKTCGITRYRWRRRRCLNVTTSANLVNASVIPRENFTKVHREYSPPLRCAGTSEEVIPCEPLAHCSVLRLPGYMREEILNYDSLYYFGILTVVMTMQPNDPDSASLLTLPHY
ncbi:unnamed protein product [Calicophoron daubneyi]|uniref:EGF-like domain-containing protein n=1 Tax=Calicophoron daubneyi TaxID=300641 RepID=A0AAV2TE84_CALDB